jgi:starch synthase (maltosyl-transferring)
MNSLPPKTLHGHSGRVRPVIDAVQPVLRPAEAILKHREKEAMEVRAHVLADGHDHLDVVLATRLRGERSWREIPMRDQQNDEFSASWVPPSIGVFEYRILAWIDPFRNWHVGFVKKSDAGDPKIAVELDIGSRLVAEASARARGKDRAQLEEWSRFLSDHSRDLMQKVALARDPLLYERVRAYPDRSLERKGDTHLIFVEREKAYASTWYEFFPRSHVENLKGHGTFSEAARRFPEIARMGFDVVYFPPIHPIGKTFRKGRNNALKAEADDPGSPWAIGGQEGGHKAIHPELGSLEDFQSLMKEAERNGLEVALDIAFQCSPDHPYVSEHPQWFKWRPDGTVQYAENPPKKYQDILPFDFETEDWRNLWAELRSIFVYWLEQGVRIFRVDNPHTKSIDFWSWCLLGLKEAYPGAIFLSEAFTRPKRKYRLAKAGFTQGYTYFTWRNHAAEMREYVEELTRSPVSDFFIPNFWPNTPDILHADLQHGTRATFVARYLLAATLVPSLGMYGPAFELMENEPFPGKEEYNHNEKYEIKSWDWDRPGNLKPEITRVNAIRKRFPSLQRLTNIRFVETDNPQLLAYLKASPERREFLLIVVSFDAHQPQGGHVLLPLEGLGFGSDKAFGVKDLLDPAEPVYSWRGRKNYVLLDPRKSPGHILRILPEGT